MTKTIQSRIKHKRDTSSNWTTKNPVLLNGEIIVVDTSEGEVRAKIGDGTKTYTQLPFSDEALRSLIAEKANLDNPEFTTEINVSSPSSVGGYSNVSIIPNDTVATIKHINDTLGLSGELLVGFDTLVFKNGGTEYNVYTEKNPPTIDVDSALSSTSTNPVQNKVVKAELDKKIGNTSPQIYDKIALSAPDTITNINFSTDMSRFGVLELEISDVVNFNTQTITFDNNSLAPKISNYNSTTGESQEGYFYTELNPPSTNANDMYGTVKIENGGTGATTAAGALANLGAANIANGSYTGTDAKSASITIGFKPKIMFIYGRQNISSSTTQYVPVLGVLFPYAGYYVPLVRGKDSYGSIGYFRDETTYSTLTVRYSSNTLSWSCNGSSTSDPIRAFNSSGLTYYYTAIG